MYLTRERKIILLAYIFGLFLLFTPSLYSTFAHTFDKSKRVFTLEELAAFDGKDGRPAYYAYEGKIYDVTESTLFKEGKHFQHEAGQDLTGQLEGAPHAEEVFAPFEVVGVLEEHEEGEAPIIKKSKAGPTTIFGKSLVAWTGYLLGIFFILNFSTCYAMPWCRAHAPWRGDRPFTDTRDWKGYFRLLVSYHKPFAYAMTFFAIIHGILGILQSFGIVF